MSHLKIDVERDCDRAQLQRILELQFKRQRMAAAKSCLLSLLGAAALPLWLDSVWPGLFPEEVEFSVMILWGGLLFVVLWAAVDEYLCRWRLQRTIAVREGVKMTSLEEC